MRAAIVLTATGPHHLLGVLASQGQRCIAAPVVEVLVPGINRSDGIVAAGAMDGGGTVRISTPSLGQMGWGRAVPRVNGPDVPVGQPARISMDDAANMQNGAKWSTDR